MSRASDVRELFVWYRVDAQHADALRIGVDAMQRSLERRFAGLRARLLVRHDADLQTWMETFARVGSEPDGNRGIDAATEAAIADAAQALRPLLASERHVEAFEVVRSTEPR